MLDGLRGLSELAGILYNYILTGTCLLSHNIYFGFGIDSWSSGEISFIELASTTSALTIGSFLTACELSPNVS